MAIYIPQINEFRYVSNVGPSPMHNSTYTVMKLFSLFAMFLFVVIKEKYLKERKIIDWILFSSALILSAYSKPSFAFAFLIVMLIELTIDFALSRGKTIWANIWFGTTVFPTLVLLVYQSVSVFDPGSKTAIILSEPLAYFKLYADSPIISVLQSMAFPLFVLAFYFPQFLKNMEYRVLTMTGLVGFLQAAFLIETGGRQYHGNFLWGYMVGMFFMFIGAVIVLYKDIASNRDGEIIKKINVKQGVSLLLFALHGWFGLVYMVGLLQGNMYF